MVRTTAVSVSGTTLVVTSAAGAKDNLAITKPSASTLRVTNIPSGAYTGSGVHTGAGCTRSGDYRANCNAAGITLIQVTSGDQIDKVMISTVVKSSLNGGAANDVLTGGSDNDTLTGRAGADVFKGMNGNDQLFARDFTSDTTINCDGGSGPGAVDKAYLDRAPQGPSPTGCETVVRQGTRIWPWGTRFRWEPARARPRTASSGVFTPTTRRAWGRASSSTGRRAAPRAPRSRNGGQLSLALADLNASSDTKALTIGIGGNDGLERPVRGALASAQRLPLPGELRRRPRKAEGGAPDGSRCRDVTTMAYYNPSSGTGGGLEASRRRMLLGNNLQVGCADTGTNVGLDDVIYQEAGKLGVPVADPYPAFRQHGQAYISSDGIHPNNAGHAAIAAAFRNPTRRCG